MEPRPIHAIARDIAREWGKPYFGAVPYLRAMHSLASPEESYGLDPGDSIVRYFLANAASFRGGRARALKAELKLHLGMKLSKAEREALAS